MSAFHSLDVCVSSLRDNYLFSLKCPRKMNHIFFSSQSFRFRASFSNCPAVYPNECARQG